MTRFATVDGSCPEGVPLKKCVYYSVGRSAVGELFISRLPIDAPALCGECEIVNPPIVNEWRENNPAPQSFTDLINLPSIRAALSSLLLNQTSVILVDSYEGWQPLIKFRWSTEQLGTYYVATASTTWANLHNNLCFEGSNNVEDPEGFNKQGSIMGARNESGQERFQCISLNGIVDTCPQKGFMPWWQGPPRKTSSINAYPCNCSISPTPDFEYGCGILYEESILANYLTRPRPIDQFDTAKSFIAVFQQWIDDNKDENEFNSNFGSFIDPSVPGSEEREVVVLFWGFINKVEGQNPKVTLELWKINQDTKILERIPEAAIENQLDVQRRFIYLVPYNYNPPIICKSNYLLTYNMNSCSLSESFVETLPDIVNPEITIIKYIPCTSVPLSESDPKEFNKIVSEFTSFRPECTGACCYLAVDGYGIYHRGCIETSSLACNKDYIEWHINNNLTFDNWRNLDSPTVAIQTKNVIWSSFDDAGSVCTDDLCLVDIPEEPSTRLGTCCHIKEDGEWGCVVNFKEQCEFLNGFFQPSLSNGLGGFNPPSCNNRGTAIVSLDDNTSTVVLLGGRECDLNSKPTPTDPEDPNPVGSCCSIMNWSDLWYQDNNDLTDVASLVRSATINIPYYGLCPQDSPSSLSSGQESGVSLSLLNDGTIIKLAFKDEAIMNNTYQTRVIANNPTSARSLRLIDLIESNFSVYADNTQAPYQVKFKRIEKNSIILSVIKL